MAAMPIPEAGPQAVPGQSADQSSNSAGRPGEVSRTDNAHPQTLPSAAASATPSAAMQPAPPGKEAPGRKRSRLRFLLLALLLAAGGTGIWFHFKLRRQPESNLVLQGNVDVRQVNLSFKVDGRIEALAVDEGDVVRTGSVIASLDKRYFEDDLRLARAKLKISSANLARLEHGSRPEEIAEARATVAERKATLERATQDFRRASGLVGNGSISRQEFDLARSTMAEAQARLKSAEEALRLTEIGPRQEDIDAARAQVHADEAAVVQAQRRLSDADLVAPGDGMILTRARERGAIVAPGETVFTLTLTSPVWVRTYVNEVDLGRIRPGLGAEVRTDSTPKVYRGSIGFISPTAEFTPKSVETRELRTDLVYRVRIVVANPDRGLRQGMPVTATLDRPTEE